jgi:transglutaminase-like putative cysteine protease
VSIARHISRFSTLTAACITLCSVAFASQAAQEFDFDVSHVQRHSASRRIRYRYSVRNTRNAVCRGVTLWLPAPVRQTANQACRNLKISRDADLLTDEHGNQVFKVVLDLVPPLGQVTVSMEANLLMGDLAFGDREALTHLAYTAPQRFIESSDPRITSRASRFKGTTNTDVGKHAFDWVGSHMQPRGRFRAPRGAAYALEYADGDCSEYAFLFTALCRARGIPARCITGVVCKRDSLLAPSMLHGWAEFYDGMRWRLADCQLRVFAAETPGYVAMRVAVDSKRIPLAAHELSGVSDPSLRLMMVQ